MQEFLIKNQRTLLIMAIAIIVLMTISIYQMLEAIEYQNVKMQGQIAGMEGMFRRQFLTKVETKTVAPAAEIEEKEKANE